MTFVLPDRPKRHFATEKIDFSIFRLRDNEYLELRARSFPIKYNNLFLLLMIDRKEDELDSLNLPKLLLLLEIEFGRSSSQYDSWKQSFSFPFILQVQKLNKMLSYLLKIEDYRASIEFRFYRIIDDIRYIDKNPDLVHDPISQDLSESEIKYIVCYIWGFYHGYIKSYLSSDPHITPFFRYIQSSNLVYGYWEDQFIEIGFDNEQDCTKLVAELEEKYGELSKSDKDRVCQTQEMILKIVS